MKNWAANIGMMFSIILVLLYCYVPWLNVVLGTRMLAPPHFALPAFPFFIVIFLYDEGRKLLVRSGIEKETGRFIGWVAQNTYY
jgi:hypothetical protein